jgi:hypothetical protein
MDLSHLSSDKVNEFFSSDFFEENKEKNIKADLEETEEEIQDFQSEKMSKLNELKVSIVLKIKQI